MKNKERVSIHHTHVRDLAIAYLGGCCVKCGSTENLHIHHKGKLTATASKDNVELLCAKCHGENHGIGYPLHNLTVGTKRTTVYLNSNHWEEFKKNAIREKSSASEEIRKFVAHYNETKRNPSLKLDTFLNKKAQSPMKVVCFHIRGATHEGMVYCGKKGWIQGVECYPCKHNQLKKRKHIEK